MKELIKDFIAKLRRERKKLIHKSIMEDLNFEEKLELSIESDEMFKLILYLEGLL